MAGAESMEGELEGMKVGGHFGVMEQDNKVNAGKARKRVIAGGQHKRQDQENKNNRSERNSEACSREVNSKCKLTRRGECERQSWSRLQAKAIARKNRIQEKGKMSCRN